MFAISNRRQTAKRRNELDVDVNSALAVSTPVKRKNCNAKSSINILFIIAGSMSKTS